MDIPAGSTSVPVRIYARASNGAALTGKAAGDFALFYRRDTGGTVAVDESAITESGGGEYVLTFPDAAFAVGSSQVSVGGTVDGGEVLGYPIALTSMAGTGARTCVLTVNDGTNPLQSARVRVTKGAESYLQQTNTAGVATFNLDDGSWTVAITLAGYTYAGTTLVVNGDETATYSMTAASFTPSTRPDTVTVRWTVISSTDFQTAPAGVYMYIRMKTPPDTDGFAWGKGERYDATDSNGVVEFPDVPVGSTIRAWLGAAGEWFDVEIPSDATSPYDAGEILGEATG